MTMQAIAWPKLSFVTLLSRGCKKRRLYVLFWTYIIYMHFEQCVEKSQRSYRLDRLRDYDRLLEREAVPGHVLWNECNTKRGEGKGGGRRNGPTSIAPVAAIMTKFQSLPALREFAEAKSVPATPSVSPAETHFSTTTIIFNKTYLPLFPVFSRRWEKNIASPLFLAELPQHFRAERKIDTCKRRKWHLPSTRYYANSRHERASLAKLGKDECKDVYHVYSVQIYKGVL